MLSKDEINARAIRLSGRAPNKYTGTLNDPFQEAQSQYAGPGWGQFFGGLQKQEEDAYLDGKNFRMNWSGFGNAIEDGGAMPRGRGQSLAKMRPPPPEDDAIAFNQYLADLQTQRRMDEQVLRAMTAQNDAGDAAERDRESINRAVAIANTPGVSQYGRPIIGSKGGPYKTGEPAPGPVDRQEIAAQMAPGLIAPPKPPAPVTFGPPEKVLVDGKRVFARAGSDGQLYGLDRKPLTPDSVSYKGPKDMGAGPSMTAPLDRYGVPLSGEAFLQTLPPALSKVVTSVLEGRAALPTGTATKDPYWKQVIEAAQLADPTFDAINYNARASTRRDFTSGKAAGQINAINTVIGHLHDLAETGKGLDNTSSDVINALRNKIQLGGSKRGVAINNFETLKEGVGTELMRVWRQVGAGSEQEIKDWKATIGAAKSPQELQGAFSTIAGMLESKLDALDSQYKQGMGTDAVTAIMPESRKRLEALRGVAPVAATPATGAAPRVNPFRK